MAYINRKVINFRKCTVLALTCSWFFQTLSFYFPPCGKIPPPVIMVQNVSFKYNENTVSIVNMKILHIFNFDDETYDCFDSCSHTYIKILSLVLTWILEWLWWDPMVQENPHC